MEGGAAGLSPPCPCKRLGGFVKVWGVFAVEPLQNPGSSVLKFVQGHFRACKGCIQDMIPLLGVVNCKASGRKRV